MTRVLASDMTTMDTQPAVGKWLIWIDTPMEHAATTGLWTAARAAAKVDEILNKASR